MPLSLGSTSHTSSAPDVSRAATLDSADTDHFITTLSLWAVMAWPKDSQQR